MNEKSAVAACGSCELRRFCFSTDAGGLAGSAETFVSRRQKLVKGERLYRAGESASNIYAVRTGFMKTVLDVADGHERVSGFQMAGELLGLDGLGTQVHAFDAIALEDSLVCVVPYENVEAATAPSKSLQREFHRILRDEIVRSHKQAGLLSGAPAEQRLAVFLQNLTERHARTGYSSTSLILRMTRLEIGVYLGMTIETVSRCLTRLQATGVLQVRHRAVTVLKPEALHDLAAGNTGEVGSGARAMAAAAR